MTESRHPQHWQAPEWHSDFGDSSVELEHLRSFAIALLRALPNCGTILETPEPGLMYLSVRLRDAITAEIHSVPALNESNNRRFAVFVSPGTPAETEQYSDSVDEALEFLIEHDA